MTLCLSLRHVTAAERQFKGEGNIIRNVFKLTTNLIITAEAEAKHSLLCWSVQTFRLQLLKPELQLSPAPQWAAELLQVFDEVPEQKRYDYRLKQSDIMSPGTVNTDATDEVHRHQV